MNSEGAVRNKILIAVAREDDRNFLKDMLKEDYELLEASSGTLAGTMLLQYGKTLDLVLLDIVLPDMHGFKIIEQMRRYGLMGKVPVVIISSAQTSYELEKAYELGVADFIGLPFDEYMVKCRIRNTIALTKRQRKMETLVELNVAENEKMSNMLVSILSHIVEFRNCESGMHVMNIHGITEVLLKILASKTGQYQINEKTASLISTASALHDIGKIAIPDKILNKPGRLTDDEFSIMKTHSNMGANILLDLPFYKDEPLIKTAQEICRWHHERFDGSGYPDGLTGGEIPISAQIVSIADVYDALTSERVYKKAFSHQQAMQMIFRGECGVFNPVLLDCLQSAEDEIQKVVHLGIYNDFNDQQQFYGAGQRLSKSDLIIA